MLYAYDMMIKCKFISVLLLGKQKKSLFARGSPKQRKIHHRPEAFTSSRAAFALPT